MNNYRLYGLDITSEIRLPEVERTDSRGDISITSGRVDLPSSVANDDRILVAVEDTVVYLSYSDIGAFEIRDGSDIVVDMDSRAGDQSVRAVLLGPALGFLLYQRDLLVLHASSVERDGSAYVFLGEKGAGKSTIAAGFVEQGYNILSDHITVVDISQRGHRVLPGRPHVKLADSRFDYEPFPSTADLEMEKQYYRMPEQDAKAADRIAGAFVLERGDSLTVEPLSGSKAVWKLLNHLYLQQFIDELDMEQCFQQVAQLTEQTTVCRLERTDALDSLPELLRMVEDAV